MRECDNSKIHFLFIFFFLRTVKYNNFVPYNLSLYNKRATATLKKKKKKSFALKRKSVTLKRAFWREVYCCCCCFCHGAQNISIKNKSEETCVKICVGT